MLTSLVIHGKLRERTCYIIEVKYVFSSKYRVYLAYPSLTAVARPPSQPDDDALSALTRPSRQRVSRTEVDYRRLHRGTLAREETSKQTTGKSSGTSESQLSTILKAIAGVCESVDERFALVQEAITEVPDIGQVKETVSGEVREIVQEQLKVIVQREILEAIGEEVKRHVQQQVSEVVRREVKSIVQREVMNIIKEKATAIVQQQVTAIVQEQVTAILENSCLASNYRARTHLTLTSRALRPSATPVT